MKKEIILLVIFLAMFISLVNAVNAVRVGIVVEFPDGKIFTRCLEVSEGANGYEVLNSAGLSLTWSPPGIWGHALCAINDVGCPSDNCWCEYPKYWGFFTKGFSDRNWEYSPVGFDGGFTCSEHYCASHGDLLGFAYGAYGTKPEKKSFEDVCPPQERRRRKFFVSIEPKEPKKGDIIRIKVIDNETSEGIRNSEIEIFEGLPGTSKTIFFGKTNRDGYIEFSIQEIGTYTLRINVHNYNPPQFYYDLTISELLTNLTNYTTTTIIIPPPTPTTTITTIITPTTTTITTTATTATTLPPITTMIFTTTTTTSTTTSTAKEQPLVIGHQIKFTLEGNLLLIFLLSLFIALLVFFFLGFKRK